MSGRARCTSCGKPIIWAVSQRGRNIPWDPEPSERGTHILILAAHLGGGYTTREPRASDGPKPELYVCHFATCRFADKHRRKKE